MARKAIIVGSAGQDGQLLASQLQQRGYLTLGCENPHRIHNRTGDPAVDISSASDVEAMVATFRPDEIYYLAAYHHSAEEGGNDLIKILRQSLEIHTLALTNFLEAIRTSVTSARLFYAASSHVFGVPGDAIQDEQTPINPTSAYGISKAAGLFACRHYRERHRVFASVGILYNHESHLRSEKFLSRRIVRGASAIARGEAATLTLGNVDAIVDWGYAPDYTEAMQKILAANQPSDFVIASGTAHTVRDFARLAFDAFGLDYKRYVVSDASIISRDAGALVGNPAHLIRTTGWRPTLDFDQMVRKLVTQELALLTEH